MPRSTTRSIGPRRWPDMPTSAGDLTGRPSPARVTVNAVRMTLSNANSLNYLNLYCPQEPKFRPGRLGLPLRGRARAYSCKRFPTAKVTVFRKETLETWVVTKKESEMPFDQLDLKRAIAGDERAMQRLWSQDELHLDAVVRRLCGDPELAADVSQEVWMQIFRALPSYRGDSQFGTWAHRIAVNRTLNALRKIRRLAKLETDIEDDSALTEQDTDRRFLAEFIGEAMARLSPGARAGVGL